MPPKVAVASAERTRQSSRQAKPSKKRVHFANSAEAAAAATQVVANIVATGAARDQRDEARQRARDVANQRKANEREAAKQRKAKEREEARQRREAERELTRQRKADEATVRIRDAEERRLATERRHRQEVDDEFDAEQQRKLERRSMAQNTRELTGLMDERRVAEEAREQSRRRVAAAAPGDVAARNALHNAEAIYDECVATLEDFHEAMAEQRTHLGPTPTSSLDDRIRYWKHRRDELDDIARVDQSQAAAQEGEETTEITVSFKYTVRLNGKPFWNEATAHNCVLPELQAAFEGTLAVEASIDRRLERDGPLGGSRIVKRTAVVRSQAAKAKRELQTVDDFSSESWIKIEDLIRQEGQKQGHFRVTVDLLLELNAESWLPPSTANKRSREAIAIDSDPLQPPTPDKPRDKKTRTNTMLGRSDARDEMAASPAFKAEKALLKEWACSADNCSNRNGWCFVDSRGEHFKMSTPEHRYWAQAIASNEPGVSALTPPQGLWEKWFTGDGTVNRVVKHPAAQQARVEKRDTAATFDKMIDMTGKMLEFQMQRQMGESMAQMVQQSTPVFQPQQAYHPPLQYQSRSPPRPYSPVEGPPISRPRTPVVLPLRSSSPVTGPHRMETAMIAFFEWKLTQTVSEVRRLAVISAQNVAYEKWWSFDDLKAMSNPQNDMYRRAIDSNIADGLARGFRNDIKLWKPIYKQQQRALDSVDE